MYDEAWFDYRLRLFESITVPSMLAQTDRDFWWLVVVDRA
ncbi:MAG: glycosyltransferase, partial [Stackebrandtia sp.]